MNLKPYKEAANPDSLFNRVGLFVLKCRYELPVRCKIVPAFFLFVVFFTFLISQQVSAGQTLTLEQCVSLALINNDSLSAGSSAVDMHTHEARISYSEFFPKLRSEAQYSLLDKEQSFIIERNAFSPGIPPSVTELPTGERDMYSFTLSVEQPVFTGGYLTSSYGRARILEKESEVKLEKIRNEIMLRVRSVYYGILTLYKMKDIQEQTLRLKEERRRVIKERYKEGASRKEDILLLDADISEQEFGLFKTENGINIEEKKLKNLIGINHDTEILLTDKLKNKKLEVNLAVSKDIALNNRKDLIQNYYMIRSAEKDIDIAESSLYPRASVVGSYTRQKETPLESPDLWAVMVTLKWDIKGAMLDVEDKWYGVKEAEQKIKIAENNLVYTEENYKNIVVKYKENIVKTSKLLEAETNLVTKKNEYINSIYGLNRALAEFAFSISSDIEPLFREEEIYGLASLRSPSSKNSSMNMSINGFSGKTENKRAKMPEFEAKGNMGKAVNVTAAGSNDKYYVQIGSWKTAELARKAFEKSKKYYPETYMYIDGNLSKVRIAGIKTRREGELILRDIKDKFNLRALLVLRK
jgi:outer membrane protein TolC